jgi:hypothetical protein
LACARTLAVFPQIRRRGRVSGPGAAAGVSPLIGGVEVVALLLIKAVGSSNPLRTNEIEHDSCQLFRVIRSGPCERRKGIGSRVSRSVAGAGCARLQDDLFLISRLHQVKEVPQGGIVFRIEEQKVDSEGSPQV